MSLQAIETHYNGYRFRSRLEARWAVFFDALGCGGLYYYEHEGYDLDGLWYLPDFWLPSLNGWVEIKGQTPSDIELTKAERLATQHEACGVVLVFVGLPGEPAYRGYQRRGGVVEEITQGGNRTINWVANERNEVSIRNLSRQRAVCIYHPRLINAFAVARQARFD